jgi:hypothetical protein
MPVAHEPLVAILGLLVGMHVLPPTRAVRRAYRFPLIVEALASLPTGSCIIDGEAVACGDDGLASFNRIRYRHHNHSVFTRYTQSLRPLSQLADTTDPNGFSAVVGCVGSINLIQNCGLVRVVTLAIDAPVGTDETSSGYRDFTIS